MIDELFAEQTLTAARDRIANPAPPPPVDRKFSVWGALTALPRGVTSAVADVSASAAELLGAYGQVAGAYPEAAGYIPPAGSDAEKQAAAARQKLLREGVSMNNDIGDSLRAAGATYRPDPATAHSAEQLIYGFARGATKITAGAMAAGPLGVAGAGLEEANTQADELAQQGVPFGPRVAAAGVQGAGLSLAALPLVGSSLKATAALYLAGGPGGFMAQQALTREILRNAGQQQVAEQFDPFDPVGLTVSALLPAAFVAHGVHAQRIARAVESLPAELPRDAAPAPVTQEPFPSRLSPVAEAVRSYPTEVVDAAMVMRLAEQVRQREQAAMVFEQSGRPIEGLTEFLARNNIKPEATPPEVQGNFLAWLRDAGGVDAAQKLDITGDANGVRNNPAGIFRKGGRSTDEMAMLAEEAGYLRPGEGADSGRFVALVQAAVRGERVLTLTEQMQHAAREQHLGSMADRLAEVEARLRLLGVDTAPAKGNVAALEAYAAAHEPEILAAAVAEARAAATDLHPLADELRARAQQVAADIRDSGRTVAQYEADVGALSPVMRRLVNEEIGRSPAAATGTDAPPTTTPPNREATPPAGSAGAAADGVPAAGAEAAAQAGPDGAAGRVLRDMTDAERADAQRAVIELRKRLAMLDKLKECIG